MLENSLIFFLQMPTLSPPELQLFSPSTMPIAPSPCGFSTPCHTWPPPAHYALFCVMLVDARAGRVWMISIHLRDPFAPPTVFSLFLSDRHIFCLSPLSPSILHLCQCTSADECKLANLTLDLSQDHIYVWC